MFNIPGNRKGPSIEPYPGKAPPPEEIVILARPLLLAMLKIEPRLTGTIKANWAMGGEAGEVMLGVNVKADRLVINTTKEGVEEIWKEMEEYHTLAPAPAEKKLEREAEVAGQTHPVYVRSHYAELTVDGAKVEVYGDQQFKVGEWEWGDPLDFTPTYTYIPGGRQLPLVPLSLQSELAIALGWLDVVELISDAVFAKHEHVANR